MTLLDDELSDIDTIDKIQDAVIKIEKDGHDAIIYHNITAAQWAARLVQISSEAIPEQERKYLAYV